MSEQKHTSGPWSVYHDGVSVCASDGHIVSTNVEGVTQEEARANARLIAAAPELLEALRQTVAALNGLPCRQQALDDAMRAILKATGR